MPLYKAFTDRLARIALWQATERAEELRDLLPEPLRAACWEEAVARFPRPARRTEWLAARVLAHRHFQIPEMLAYAPSGRPYAPFTESFISISHSHGYVAVALSAVPVGIDIELYGRRAWELREKFLTPAELTAMAGGCPQVETPQAALFAWTAKEAAFKYYAHHVPLKVITDVKITRFTAAACHVASARTENGSALVRLFSFGGLACAVAAAADGEARAFPA